MEMKFGIPRNLFDFIIRHLHPFLTILKLMHKFQKTSYIVYVSTVQYVYMNFKENYASDLTFST